MGLGRVAASVAAVGAGLLVLGACGISFGSETSEDDMPITGSVTGVQVSNGSGNVRIRTGETASVHRIVHYTDESKKPGDTARVDNGTLVLDECKSNACWIDYDVVLPAGIKLNGDVSSGTVELNGVSDVNLRANSGDVTIRNASGAVTVQADSGKVHLIDVAGAVVVNQSSGSVELTNTKGTVQVTSNSGRFKGVGLGGATTIESDSGDVEIDLAKAADVRAITGSGDLVVRVPQDRYRVTAAVDSGELTTSVPNDGTGSHLIDVKADSGDLTLSYR